MLLCSVMSFRAVAQKGMLVQGHVKDATTGEALVGVTIVEVDKENRFVQGVPTDLNGFYMIKLTEENSRLRFAYIGYDKITEVVNGRAVLNVNMQEANTRLETVEVRGDRYTSDGLISLKDKATAIAQVKLDDLDQMGVASVDEMLQGQISNVDITAVSGDPGAGMQIRIRGTATINGDREPLIVLDGLPYDVRIDNTFDFNSADSRDYGALLSISPDDIASIEILKDAASAAIWGSKAANGVIQITTRRGRKMKPQLRYNYKGFLSVQPDAIPMLSGPDYVTYQKEARFNVKGSFADSDIPELNYDKDWELYHNYSQDTDWLGAITQTARSDEHNVSLAGGGEKARYRVGMGYFNQEGTTRETLLQRLSFRANLDYNVTDRLKISTDFSYTRSDNDRTYYGDERSVAYKKMPNQSIYERDSLNNLTGRYFLDTRPSAFESRRTPLNSGGMYNPVAVIDKARHNYLESRFRSVFRIKYNVTDYLLLMNDISFDLVNGATSKFMPVEASSSDWSTLATNVSSQGASESFNVQSISQAIFTPNLGTDHELTVVGRWEAGMSSSTPFSVTAGGLPTGEFNSPGAGGLAPVSLSAGNSESRRVAAVVRGHYKWKDRYIVDLGTRLDASSNFGPNTTWGAFPFSSAAWRISNEPFLEDVMWMNELKIRGSFGVNGRAPGGFNHYSIYKAGGAYVDALGVYPSNARLNNLKWERITQANLGFEAALFDNRLNLEFDVYQKKSTDLLWTLNVPTASGFSSMTRNQGEMSNKGIEFSFRGVPYKTKDWRVDVQFNIAKNLNTVDEIPENFSLKSGNVLDNGNYATRVVTGDPIGGFYGYRYKGVYKNTADAIVRDDTGEIVIDQNTGKPMRMLMGGSNYTFQGGDAIYEDINHDGVIDEGDIVFLGSSNPDFTGGFGFRVSYKGLSLSSNFHYRVGQDIVNDSRMRSENMYGNENQNTATMRRWRYPGDDTDIPRAVYDKAFNWLGSDRFVEDGSYLRWKNLSVNYRFEKSWLKRFNVTDLSVFFTAYNLYTFTDYTGQDPEVPLGADPFSFGIDRSTTPPSRTYTMGLTVIF
ncbi:SusC/RagA family TonB-linked outer membrane protein [Fulvitalea axinellae]|uniref:SusC/RagA family TonB-linked outer membrane protein n=2 Tax=Fulvitalea axinellae TaxID=1182444 RepID=A0AAU9CKY8_9BACT|nr:SusC/RagA family TonB-linked outer membrane protein [Fulvitalea axinellae]